MSIFRKLSESFYYYTDSLKVVPLKTKVEYFQFDEQSEIIMVFYRLGRQKLLIRLRLDDFEREYFGSLSRYDQYRVTKFSTMQNLVKNLFSEHSSERIKLINFIKDQVRNERCL